MKPCLIALYGGTTKWIELSLRNYPDIDNLIVLANPVHVTKEGKNLYQDLKSYITSLQKFEDTLPKDTQRKYTILDVPDMDSYYDTIGFFRALFLALQSMSMTELILQSGSGPEIWQVCLYQCAEEFRDIIKKLFMYNKLTGKEELIRIYREFNDTEKNVLDILKNHEVLTMSKLEQLYESMFDKKTLSYLLKTINRLAEEGLIDDRKEGRDRLIKISDNGFKMLFNKELQQSIEHSLKY